MATNIIHMEKHFMSLKTTYCALTNLQPQHGIDNTKTGEKYYPEYYFLTGWMDVCN